MRIKERIIILVISLAIYFALAFIYNNIVVKDEYYDMYVLSCDVKRGEKISSDKLLCVKYKSAERLETINMDNDLENMVFLRDYTKGQVVTNDSVSSEEEFLSLNEEKEIVVIKIAENENNLCSSIKPGDIVNVFVTAKTNELVNIMNGENVESYTSDSVLGITTVKLLENIEVLKCYDAEGNVKKDGEKLQNVMFEVDNDMAIKISNLKTYAEFSLSLSR